MLQTLNMTNLFSTHPSLRFAYRGDFTLLFLYPLSGEAEERVVQRSVDRVSRLPLLLTKLPL